MGRMGALKELKKLKKKTKKAEKKALKHLSKLSNIEAKTAANNNDWHDDIKELSQEVLVEMVTELKTPLNPIISWFNDNQPQLDGLTEKRKVKKYKKDEIKVATQQPASRNILSIPLKSPACKKCPALANGTCKCAAKKFKHS